MSQTRILCEKCGFPQAFCACDRSTDGPKEVPIPAPVPPSLTPDLTTNPLKVLVEAAGTSMDGTPSDTQRKADIDHFSAWMDSRINKNAMPDRVYVWNAACAYARRLILRHLQPLAEQVAELNESLLTSEHFKAEADKIAYQHRDAMLAMRRQAEMDTVRFREMQDAGDKAEHEIATLRAQLTAAQEELARVKQEANEAHHQWTKNLDLLEKLKDHMAALQSAHAKGAEDTALLDHLAMLIVTQYAVTIHADPKAGTLQLFVGGPQTECENNLRALLRASARAKPEASP